MFYRTDDPVLDYYNWEAAEAAELEKLPKCAECGEPIVDDFCYEIDGELICEHCLKDNHRHWVEEYIE